MTCNKERCHNKAPAEGRAVAAAVKAAFLAARFRAAFDGAADAVVGASSCSIKLNFVVAPEACRGSSDMMSADTQCSCFKCSLGV